MRVFDISTKTAKSLPKAAAHLFNEDAITSVSFP
jgi:hypothetical protein